MGLPCRQINPTPPSNSRPGFPPKDSGALAVPELSGPYPRNTMNHNITALDVRTQASRLSAALSALTGAPQPISISKGSKLDGISWRAYTDTEGDPFPTVGNFGHIGMTSREAYDRLHQHAVALEAAKRLTGSKI